MSSEQLSLKENLNGEDFSSVAKAVPSIDQMMGMAPKVEESSSTLGRISSMFGNSSKKVSGIPGLTSSFEKLGLSGNMVDTFIPIILDYVNKNGGEKVMSLLRGALLSFFLIKDPMPCVARPLFF